MSVPVAVAVAVAVVVTVAVAVVASVSVSVAVAVAVAGLPSHERHSTQMRPVRALCSSKSPARAVFG